MYSWEITKAMEANGYFLDSDTYFRICDTSPQINNIAYNGYNQTFHMSTNDGYEWTFAVYRKVEK